MKKFILGLAALGITAASFSAVAPVKADGYLSASQTSVSLSAGSSTQVSIYSSSSQTLYVASIINTNAVNASLNGNVLTIFGSAAGNGQVQVCSQDGSCVTINVAVSYQGYNYSNPVTVDRSDITLYAGQNTTINVLSGTQPYFIASSVNTNVATASVSGSQVMINAVSSGTATFSICAFNSESCVSVMVTVLSGNSNGGVLGANTYQNGTLVNDNGTIYITYKNTVAAFANPQAFLGLGFKWSQVIKASTYGMISYHNNDVYSATSAHPWGSWIRSGHTIYFVTDQGLIPIPTYDIFTSNGGNPKNIENMNSADSALTVLPVMTYNDIRLQ